MPALQSVASIGSHVRLRAWRHEGTRTDFLRSSAHDDVEIAVFDEGATRYRAGSKEISADAHAMAVVPRAVEHRNAFDARLEGTALSISDAMVGEISDAMGARGRTLAFGLVRSTRALALARLLVCEAKREDEGRILAGEALAEALVVELVRTTSTHSGSGARDPRIRIALDRLRSSYADDLSVDDLAKSAGMSRFHFSRVFRDQVGEAPYKHLLRIRIARATELLRSGRHTVTEAAYAVGYSDLGRFARAFRAENGVSPSTIRTANRTKRMA